MIPVFNVLTITSGALSSRSPWWETGGWGTSNFLKSNIGTFLVVQWLRLHASTAGDMRSIPCQGTKILYALWQKKQY